MNIFIEPLIASLIMMMVGIFSIKFVGKIAKVNISYKQSLCMSAIFAFFRFLLLVSLRFFFEVYV
jgi:hypothetical protein